MKSRGCEGRRPLGIIVASGVKGQIICSCLGSPTYPRLYQLSTNPYIQRKILARGDNSANHLHTNGLLYLNNAALYLLGSSSPKRWSINPHSILPYLTLAAWSSLKYQNTMMWVEYSEVETRTLLKNWFPEANLRIIYGITLWQRFSVPVGFFAWLLGDKSISRWTILIPQ